MLELLSLDSSFVKKNNKKRFRDTLPFDVKKQTPSIAEDHGLVQFFHNYCITQKMAVQHLH